MLDGWYKAYPQVRVWMDAQIRQAVNVGYSRTLLGRYRWPDKDRITGSRGRSARGEEERSFCNSLIQGSAADMTMQSMLRMREDAEFVNTGARMIMQVHDEVIVECPWTKVDTVVERMRVIMEQPFSRPLRVPMPVSIGVGPSWATAKCLCHGEAWRHGGQHHRRAGDSRVRRVQGTPPQDERDRHGRWSCDHRPGPYGCTDRRQ